MKVGENYEMIYPHIDALLSVSIKPIRQNQREQE